MNATHYTKQPSIRVKCLFLLLFASSLATGVYAQGIVPNSEATAMANMFVHSYDSLLNTYIIHKYNTRQSRSMAVSETSIDLIPDTVIASRLRSLHTTIPMTYNQQVKSYIRLYLNRMSSRMDVMLTLLEYYTPIFEEAFARYNVPEEIKYLAIVESAMNPQATSRVGAAGIWQFMYTTGKNYGLEVNSIVDERRDVYKSSDAAAHYLHDLHRVYGDWTLAIAAYNCGPSNINKAIMRSGEKRTFWQIYPYLPRETRGYIPAFIAATYVMNFYSQHGLHPTKVSIPLRTDTILVERNMYFVDISRYTGVEMAELRSLNPQYRVDFIPGNDGSYPLCLPVNKMDLLIDWADSIFAAAEHKDTRQSKPGQGQAVASSQLEEDEPILDDSAKQGTKNHKKKAKNKKSSSQYHKVRRGETLTSIAQKHGTTVSKLKKLNGLKSDRIQDGERLKVR